MSTVLNVSFCCDHFKGGDGINRMRGQEHWEWLEESLIFLESLCDWPIFVSMTGFRGFESVENAPGNCERDVLWRIFARRRVRLVTMVANPGHQVGAAWCIRLGLEAAHKLGYKYLVHTAEDVVPARVLYDMAHVLNDGADYVCEAWGESRDELSAQFFACRTDFLGAAFDPCAVGSHGYLERYLRDLMVGKKVFFTGSHGWMPIYRTTHDLKEWRRWVAEKELCNACPLCNDGARSATTARVNRIEPSL